MASPTLGEITGIRGDAAIAAGTAPTSANLAELAPDQLALSMLDRAAGAQAAQNKYIMDQHYKNVQDYMKNFNEMDVSGLMEADYPQITGEYARLAKDMANNYDVLMNPMKDMARYSELKAREAKLRGDIAQSKQDVALRQIYNNFLSQHADFRNPQNEARVSRFTEATLSNRNREDMMMMQPKWDQMQAEFSKAANIAAQAKTKEQDDAKPFQTTTEINTFYKDAYDDAIRTMLKGSDAYNRAMMGAVQDSFDNADPAMKALYQNPDGSYRLEDYAVDRLYGPLRQQTDIAVTRSINPLAKIEAETAQQLAAIKARGAQERLNMQFGKDLGDQDAELLANEIPVRQVSTFKLPDQPDAKREVIQVVGKKSSGNAAADKAIDQFANLFGVNTSRASQVVEGVPLTLDTWMTNAYSIPGPKQNIIDETTGKIVETDSYMRPEKAWVTTEKNPNARKVVVRYKRANGEDMDMVFPYTENFQLLNGAMGQNNAVKVGAAKAKLLKKRTGKTLPAFEELNAIPEFQSANQGSTTLQVVEEGGGPVVQQPGVLVTPSTPAATPSPTRSLKYSDFKNQK